MKNNGIESISYNSSGDLVIKFAGKGENQIKKESQMTSKEKEIKNFLSSTNNKSISAREEFKDNHSSPNKKGNDNTGLILGGLVIVGIIAIVIAVIVVKNKKQEKY